MQYPGCIYGGSHAGDMCAVRNKRGTTVAGLCHLHAREHDLEREYPGYHLRPWEELAARETKEYGIEQSNVGLGKPGQETPFATDSREADGEEGVYRDGATTGEVPIYLPTGTAEKGLGNLRVVSGPPSTRGQEREADAPRDDHSLTDRPAQGAVSPSENPVGKEVAPVGQGAFVPTIRTEGVADKRPFPDFAWWTGAGELVLDDFQRETLQAPFDLRLVKWNYNGEHYIPWINYWKRLLEAFAPSIPQLVPLGEPQIHGDTVSREYVMLCNGMFLGIATGEMSKKGGNKTVTFARCVEGCVSDAITRIGKRLGMGLELWDQGTIDYLQKERKRG